MDGKCRLLACRLHNRMADAVPFSTKGAYRINELLLLCIAQRPQLCLNCKR